jgi:hypothetical protein
MGAKVYMDTTYQEGARFVLELPCEPNQEQKK